MILLAGFGPFADVHRNPAETLVRRVDGARVCGHTLRGLVLPVSYRRAPEVTLELAGLPLHAVIGFGVAMAREMVSVELGADRPQTDARPDINGRTPPSLRGRARIAAGFCSPDFASGLGGVLSTDAGDYVCNAWLYQVQAALDVPVGFVHLPPSGLAPGRLLGALAGVLAVEKSAATARAS